MKSANLWFFGRAASAPTAIAMISAAAASAISPLVARAAFVPGDVVVSQVGDGTNPLKSADLMHDLSSAVFLDQFTPIGTSVSQLPLPTAGSGANHGLITSGGSKSEGALMLSSDGRYLTYIGYDTATLPSAIGTPDVNTQAGVNRVIARVDGNGNINTTTSLTDAYIGDNARAVTSIDGGQFYSVGNAGKSTITTIGPRYSTLGASTSTLLGTVTGTPSKSDNFRGIQLFNGNVYTSKGSGGTGSNGIFLIGPTSNVSGGETTTPLPGLSQVVGADGPNVIHPFGFYFANPTTLYIADEGFATSSPTPSPLAGLQKWQLSNGTWTRLYTLTNGLNLGQAETISGVTSYTEGLRNLAARPNSDGTITFYAITAQNDLGPNNGDSVPDQLVTIIDSVGATSLPASESFNTLADSPANTVFRGVALAPSGAVPEPASAAMLFIGSGTLLMRRRRRE